MYNIISYCNLILLLLLYKCTIYSNVLFWHTLSFLNRYYNLGLRILNLIFIKSLAYQYVWKNYIILALPSSAVLKPASTGLFTLNLNLPFFFCWKRSKTAKINNKCADFSIIGLLERSSRKGQTNREKSKIKNKKNIEIN